MKRIGYAVILLFGWGLPLAAFGATAAITEIMYDLPGSDTDREWVEVQNTGSEPVTFAAWKFFEGNTNHTLTLNRGDAATSPGGFAVIADNPAKFLIDWPGFLGTLFDSSFSLGNVSETFSLKFEDAVIDTVTYASSTGAAGDGNSLQKLGAVWQALSPTPGAAPVGSGGAAPPRDFSGDASGASATPAQPPPAHGADAPLVIYVTVRAELSKSAPIGANVDMKATAFGIKQEPLPNAKFIWSFGDGGSGGDAHVSHVYHYPGRYAVLVTAVSGEHSATDRADILIIEPVLSIPRIKEGADGFVEVRNGGTVELDVSGFMLKSGAAAFVIPQGTVLLSGNTTAYPGAVTHLFADPRDTVLLYPSGKEAARYAPEATPPPSKSPPMSPPAAKKTAPVPIAVKEALETPQQDSLPQATPAPEASGTSSLLVAAVGADGIASPFLVPLLSLGALLGVSVAGYLFLLRKPVRKLTEGERMAQEAEEYTFIE